MYFSEHVNNVRSCSFKYRSLYFIKIKNSYADRSFVAVTNARHPSPESDPPHIRGVPPPLMDGAAAGTWRGETDALGLHGVDVAMDLARMLLPGVPLGRPNTTGWRGPQVKARPWEVKRLDLVVNRSRIRRDGGPGGVAMPPEHRTGPLYMRGGVVACPKRRHASPGCGPPSRTTMKRW